MGYYWSVMLEQCSSLADLNVPEDQLAGFEIIRNVVENFFTNVGDTERYDPQLQAASYETVKLIPYKGDTMALHLRSDKLIVCIHVCVCVGVCMCVCVSIPRLLITSVVMWHDTNPI